MAGEKPSRGGGNPFMSGTIGEWAAERNKAVDEAVPRIIERLRPKYGRMYNFDDAQPGNVRLLAMSIQPSLTNRYVSTPEDRRLLSYLDDLCGLGAVKSYLLASSVAWAETGA